MEIGLFPLGLVLLPGEQVPLHIFEPRYRELIGECLAQSTEFGLVLADDEGMREVGTTAAVVEVLERFPDGRLDIVVEGRERFEIVERTSGRSFLTVTVELSPDDGSDCPSSQERDRCLAAFHALAEAAGTEPDEPTPELGDVSFWIAARVDLGTSVKQELLEQRSPRRRARRLVELLGRARTTLAWMRTASERGTTNGRVEPPG